MTGRGSAVPRRFAAHCLLLLAALLPVGVPTSLRADAAIVGDVERVHDRAIIVVNRQPIRLWGVVAPRIGEPYSADSQLLLRNATLGRQAVCEPFPGAGLRIEPRQGTASTGRILARCRVGAMDLSALLVSSGFARPCEIDGERPYARLAPRRPGATAGEAAAPACPNP